MIDTNELVKGLEKLRGLDYEAAASAERDSGNFTATMRSDERFQARLAAMALNIPVQDIRELPLKNYSEVVRIVFNFLFGVDSKTLAN